MVTEKTNRVILRSWAFFNQISTNLKKLVEYCKIQYPDQENVKRLVKKFNPKQIVETLPTSKYTAYSQNKGEKLAFCLDTEKNDGNIIDLNTLTFVAIHELSHIMTDEVGHTPKFWDNMRFLLEKARDIGIYIPEDYDKTPKMYCGLDINSSPYKFS